MTRPNLSAHRPHQGHSLRQSLLAVSSLSLVALAGGAVLDAALAQDVPVTFGTDPGAAHPRYAQPATYRDRAAAQPVSLSFVADQAPAAPPARKSVTVEPGDTVYGIARAHGLAPAELIAANALDAPYTLALGQTLILPVAATLTQVAQTAQDIETAQAQSAAVEAPINSAPRPHPVAPHLVAKIERIEEADRLDALYAVRPGDTLFGLSRRFGVPVAALASANDLAAPYSLTLGQRLIVPAVVPATEVGARADGAETGAPIPLTGPLTDDASPAPLPAEAEAFLVDRTTPARFAWPLKGAIIASYGQTVDGQRNDGINIAAPEGTPIRAAAGGEVVYRGDELAGYGNLLLVKHEDGWVSAYAHAGDILVAKGDRVAKGQVVARVGDTGAVDSPQLHFELRHDLQPQDPIQALSGALERASFTASGQ